ncbi:MAG: hypothetical protein ACE5EI_03555 [Thermodesulfobacteriota bacterium]
MRILSPIIACVAAAAALAALVPAERAGAGERVTPGGSLSHTLKVPGPATPGLRWGRDIFAPLVKDVSKGPDVRLTAIFYNAERPSAIVNDRIVYKGSDLDGQKVVDIGKTHVILLGESGTTRLEIAGVPEFPDAR